MSSKNYTVLARKWRPQAFDGVVGQEHITRTLKNAIASGRIHHAFLFIGSRGIGKTTTARILAKALNCSQSDRPTIEPCGECDNCVSIAAGNNIDVIEIDGASNNGVDDVREIRDNIRMVPTAGRYKVYIIDEVHQLSIAAFNALLKTLEEPPAHAVFILATTESHKIPATIVSRCQRYDFRRVTASGIVQLLRGILDKEGVKATDEALYAIARAAEGGVRDSESILDQLITYCDGEISFHDVFDVLGLVDWRVLHGLCDAIIQQNIAKQLLLVEEVVAGGKDLSLFVEEILRYFRNLLVCKTSNNPELLRMPPEEVAEIEARANRFGLVKLIRLVEEFATLTNGFDSQLAQRTALEVLLIRLSKVAEEISLDTVMEKLLLLGTGGIVPASAPATPTTMTRPVAPPPAAPASPPEKTPPNPPEAGPADTAPTVPAPIPRRITFESSALEKAWADLADFLDETPSTVRTLFPHLVPKALENRVLTLRFRDDDITGHAAMERPEVRKALEAFIRAHAEGIDTLQLAAPAESKRAAVENTARRSELQSQYQKLAETNAGLAAVLKVFPGKIIPPKISVQEADDAEMPATTAVLPILTTNLDETDDTDDE